MRHATQLTRKERNQIHRRAALIGAAHFQLVRQEIDAGLRPKPKQIFSIVKINHAP